MSKVKQTINLDQSYLKKLLKCWSHRGFSRYSIRTLAIEVKKWSSKIEFQPSVNFLSCVRKPKILGMVWSCKISFVYPSVKGSITENWRLKRSVDASKFGKCLVIRSVTKGDLWWNFKNHPRSSETHCRLAKFEMTV